MAYIIDYVDNMAIVGSNWLEVDLALHNLTLEFVVIDFGDLNFFICKDLDRLFIDQ